MKAIKGAFLTAVGMGSIYPAKHDGLQQNLKGNFRRRHSRGTSASRQTNPGELVEWAKFHMFREHSDVALRDRLAVGVSTIQFQQKLLSENGTSFQHLRAVYETT